MTWTRVSQVGSHQEQHLITFVNFGVSKIRSTGNATFETSSRISKRSFDNVAQLRYFGTTLTDQNLIQ
jgi:hypothetical protein